MKLTAKQQTMLEEVAHLMQWEAANIEADGHKLCLSYVKDGASHISEPEGKGAFWARLEGMRIAAQVSTADVLENMFDCDVAEAARDRCTLEEILGDAYKLEDVLEHFNTSVEQIAAENNPDSNPLVGMAATVVYGKSPDDVMQAIQDMRHHLQGNNILGDARAQTEWVL